MNIQYTCLGDWEAYGVTLAKNHWGHQFALGDWLNSGEAFLDDDESRYKRAAELLDVSAPHLRNVAYVARRIEPSLRNDDSALKWNHFVAVAPLAPEQQSSLLQRVADDGLSVRALRDIVQAAIGPSGESVEEDVPPQPDIGTLALLSDSDWFRLHQEAVSLGKTPAELGREIIVQWLDETPRNKAAQEMVLCR